MGKENRDNRKRLAMDIPLVLHNDLKLMSIRHQCTITSYVIRAILQKLDVEAKREGQKEV